MPVRAFSAFYQGKEKEKQYQLAIALKQFIPPGSRVALYSNEEQYFLANLSSCDLKKYSYSFITYLPDDKIYASADYVIFDKIHVPDTARMRLVYNINYAAEIKPGIYIFKKNVTP